MKVLVTGGRDQTNRSRIWTTLEKVQNEYGEFSALIHGGARGVDMIAHAWAHANGIPTVRVDALWDFEGRSAGAKRNNRMVSLLSPDLCVAFPGGVGTAHMMRTAVKAGVRVVDVDDTRWWC